MNTHADKASEHNNQSVANGISQFHNGSIPTFKFVDNRPETKNQNKLLELAKSSAKTHQLKGFQEIANRSYQAKQIAQLKSRKNSSNESMPARENKTGMPDALKAGIENLSGYSMDDVKVHYNSDKPAQFQAHAYAQGTDIHVAPGQEKHLPHEAWHVVQQKEGRVKPTLQLKDGGVNDDQRLEKEADVMGFKALASSVTGQDRMKPSLADNGNVMQRMIIRIRDIAEMMHLTKSTIMDASKKTGGGMSGSASHKEDVGISKAVKGRQLEVNEELRIVAHGSEPSLPGFISSGLPTLGGFTPSDLATRIAGLFPEGYNGTIYLNGCYTATRLDFRPGTSYIELFARSLASIRSDIQFTVSGNLGPAATLESGHELITLDKSVADIAKKKGWPVNEVESKESKDIKYKVLSPFGMGYASHTGDYNDMGLTEAFNEERQRIRDEQLRREAPQKVERLRSQNFSAGNFSINASGNSEGNEYIVDGML